MKKYLFIFAYMAISSVLLIGCSSPSRNIPSTEKENISKETTLKEPTLSKVAEATDWKITNYETINDFNGVTMSVKKETLSAKGLTVILENKSDKLCTYGSKFILEKKINGLWYKVPVSIKGDYAFTDEGYDIASGHSSEWKVDWNWLYGSLDTGEYRIVKDVLDFRKTGDYDKYFLSVEFIITN